MINWRKPLIYILSLLEGSNRINYYKRILEYEKLSSSDLETMQKEKLKNLLLHAYQHVPYYRRELKKAKVVVDGKVNLSNFHKIPILTKDVIRANYNDLISDDYKLRKPFDNTSGGSTGEPIRFIQDKEYLDWNVATKLYIRSFAGQEVGMKEIRLWGSERDILKGSDSFAKRLSNFIFNRKDLNSFRMTDEDLKRFVRVWNTFKPTWVEAYVQSIYEFAKYVRGKGIDVHSPKGVLSSAGNLENEVKEYLENTFSAPVFNRYGSREVGDIACNCLGKDHLHLNVWSHYLEIIENRKFKEKSKGGDVVVTLLTNYSMPLIRYQIGDVASLGSKCDCGRSTPLLKKIVGRSVGLIKRKDGTVIDGEYFTHVFYFRDWLKKFQVVQEDINTVVIKFVLKDGVRQIPIEEKRSIEKDLRAVWREKLKWKKVSEIPNSRSGKYMFVWSKIT